MTTAQESFRMMMRDQVGPWLRELCFKGSGREWRLPSDTHWVLIGFQRSTSSTAGGLRFTMNVTVAERERWKEARLDRPYIPEKPSPNIFYGTYIWQERIGRLMRSGNDRWWSLEGGEDTQPLAVELLAAIRLFALPAIEEHLASDASA